MKFKVSLASLIIISLFGIGCKTPKSKYTFDIKSYKPYIDELKLHEVVITDKAFYSQIVKFCEALDMYENREKFHYEYLQGTKIEYYINVGINCKRDSLFIFQSEFGLGSFYFYSDTFDPGSLDNYWATKINNRKVIIPKSSKNCNYESSSYFKSTGNLINLDLLWYKKDGVILDLFAPYFRDRYKIKKGIFVFEEREFVDSMTVIR